MQILSVQHHADQVFELFQRAYRVEAGLIGVNTFPPLERKQADIRAATTDFAGVFEGARLIACIETQCSADLLDIHSLAVDPDYARQGLGRTLVQRALTIDTWRTATVSTARANKPALTLYSHLGFQETAVIKRDNIEIVELTLRRDLSAS